MSVSTRLTSCPIVLVLPSCCACRTGIVALHDFGAPQAMLRCDVTARLASSFILNKNHIRSCKLTVCWAAPPVASCTCRLRSPQLPVYRTNHNRANCLRF
jgi:hypothetical protein